MPRRLERRGKKSILSEKGAFMKEFHIGMHDIPRVLGLVPEVDSFGYTVNPIDLTGKSRYLGKIEFCLRLASPAPFAREFFGGKEYRASFPHLLIKPSGWTRTVFTEKGREAFYLIYSVSALEEFFGKIGWENYSGEGVLAEKCFRKLVVTPRIVNLLEELSLLAAHSGEGGSADRIDLISFALLEEFFLAEKLPGADENFYEEKIGRIASYLQLHFREKITLSLLAEENALSLRSLFRHWKRIFGDTPCHHLQELRLAEASRLLETGDQGVSAVAEQSGFPDGSYFVRVFKKRYGVTPAVYRKTLAANRA